MAVNALIAAVAAAIAEHGLFLPADRLLVGFSGGVDSVCVLHALKQLGYDVGAAHLDHGLRPDSAEEALTLARWCEEWGIPYVAKRVDLSRFAGLEEAGREARYVFLNQVAAEQGYSAIVLGHHLDDQAETMLFRLARGTGPAGLAAMRPRRMQASGLPLVRPLLGLTRQAIEKAVADWGLPWLEDPSNAETGYARNRIRRIVMPELRRINSEAARHMGRLADLIAEEEGLREEEVARLANYGVRFIAPGVGEVDRRALLALPPVTRRRLLRWLVGHLGGGWDQADLAAALAVAETARGADVAGGWHVMVEGESLVVKRAWRSPPPAPFRFSGEQATLPWGWRVSVGDASAKSASPVLVRYARGELPANLVWRSARPETDVFRPWGREKAERLGTFLTRSAIPRHHHETLLVLASEEAVYWVVGIRRGGQAPIGQTPEDVCEMQAIASFAV